MIFKCPHCDKEVIANNLKQDEVNNDIVIKARLIFLNEDGNILCRCSNCKKIISLPLTFNSKENNVERIM